MQLGLTIPLQKFLRVKQPPYGEIDDLFFCWDVHRVVLDGCDVLLAVNASNRFATISCMQVGMWRCWEDEAVSALRSALEASSFSERIADAYLFYAGAPEVTKTHGRRSVAFLNVLVDGLHASGIPVDCGVSVQGALCRYANEDLSGKAAGFDGAGFAAQRFADDLRRLGIDGVPA